MKGSGVPVVGGEGEGDAGALLRAGIDGYPEADGSGEIADEVETQGIAGGFVGVVFQYGPGFRREAGAVIGDGEGGVGTGRPGFPVDPAVGGGGDSFDGVGGEVAEDGL